MKPIKITVKSKRFDDDHAQWSLSLINGDSETYMCDNIYRPEAQDITVTAELAAIWTVFTQIRGYQWLEINCCNETAVVLKWFLYGQAPDGYDAAYRHLSGHMAKHNVMINPDSALGEMVASVMELNPAMRSRTLRASQLVTMGAVWRQREGYNCWTFSHPENPYHIKRGEDDQWECNCPDSNAPTLTRDDNTQVCKHLLAAMMDYRLRENAVHVRQPMRKAA